MGPAKKGGTHSFVCVLSLIEALNSPVYLSLFRVKCFEAKIQLLRKESLCPQVNDLVCVFRPWGGGKDKHVSVTIQHWFRILAS